MQTKELTNMENNKYIDVSIEIGEEIKPFIRTGNNGKKYLDFRVTPNKNGIDTYGNSHNVSIRYKAVDGNYYTQYIGKGKERTFGEGNGNRGPLPAPAPRQASAPAQGASAAAAAMASQATPAPSAPSTKSEDSDLPFD